MDCKCCKPTAEINEQKLQALKEIEFFTRQLMKDWSNVDRDTLRKIRECISFIENFNGSTEISEEAIATAKTALAKAEEALLKAESALSTAEGINVNLDEISSDIETALANAQEALHTADSLNENIERANVLAENAQSTADTAETVALIADRRAITAQSTQHNCLSDRIHNISHRGWGNAPENTIPAYRESVRRGYKYVEADVSKTSDGVYVLLHDETIDRTSNGTGRIDNLTFEEARQYDYGSWKHSSYTGTQIPTLDEFIHFCRDTGIHPYIELKQNLTEADINPIVNIVNRHSMLNNCTWVSFNYSLLVALRAVQPTARVGYAVSGIADSHIAQVTALQEINKNAYLCAYLPTLTEGMINKCKANDIAIEVWSGVITNDDIRNADPYITGFNCDTSHVQNALAENNGTVIFFDTANPLYGDNILNADFTGYKKLDIYVRLPSYTQVVTMQLEYPSSNKVGTYTGYPVYSAHICVTSLDSRHADPIFNASQPNGDKNSLVFYDFVVALDEEKRNMSIYRSGFFYVEALIADSTKTLWNERKNTDYVVYKVVGYM